MDNDDERDEDDDEEDDDDEYDGEDIRMNMSSDGECEGDKLDDLPSSRGNQWKVPISRKASQTSVYLQEWDIPFEQLDLGELIGKVRSLSLCKLYVCRVLKEQLSEGGCSSRADGARCIRVGGTGRWLSDFWRSTGIIRTI